MRGGASFKKDQKAPITDPEDLLTEPEREQIIEQLLDGRSPTEIALIRGTAKTHADKRSLGLLYSERPFDVRKISGQYDAARGEKPEEMDALLARTEKFISLMEKVFKNAYPDARVEFRKLCSHFSPDEIRSGNLGDAIRRIFQEPGYRQRCDIPVLRLAAERSDINIENLTKCSYQMADEPRLAMVI